MVTAEQVLAVLKRLGPCAPGTLADELGTDTHAIRDLLKKLLDEKKIEATGVTKSRRLKLPEQKFDAPGAPPQPSKPPPQQKKKRGKKASKPRSAKAAAAPAPRPAVRFIPTVDAEKRLHIINGAEPVSFDESQTEAIASLLLQHYEV